MKSSSSEQKQLMEFLNGKSEHTLRLFHHFVDEYKKIGNIHLTATKSMIALTSPKKKLAYITQLGRNFVHVVFPFEKPYLSNLCFQKIAQVPGDAHQFNHHFRMFEVKDVNK